MAQGKKNTKLWEYQQRAKQEEIPCAKCGKTGWTTVDHIIPHGFVAAVGLQNEGYDHDWNLQFLCRACNTLKGNQFDFTDPRTLENLKRYVALLEEIYQ